MSIYLLLLPFMLCSTYICLQGMRSNIFASGLSAGSMGKCQWDFGGNTFWHLWDGLPWNLVHTFVSPSKWIVITLTWKGTGWFFSKISAGRGHLFLLGLLNYLPRASSCYSRMLLQKRLELEVLTSYYELYLKWRIRNNEIIEEMPSDNCRMDCDEN